MERIRPAELDRSLEEGKEQGRAIETKEKRTRALSRRNFSLRALAWDAQPVCADRLGLPLGISRLGTSV